MFNVAEIFEDELGFVEWMDSCFDHLEADAYDTLLGAERLFKNKLPEAYARLKPKWEEKWKHHEMAKDFWIKHTSDRKLQNAIEALTPTRTRGCFHYFAHRQPDKAWVIRENGNPIFKQEVDDERGRPRKYSPIPPDYRRDNDFLKLLAWVCELVYRRPISSPNLSLTAHFMRTYAVKGVNTNPAPEGIHRDGANFIVSGIVLERKNVVGGASKIYLEDKETLVFEKELQPGEGIFQVDEDNNYWHSVTDLARRDSRYPGYRSIVGFDINIKR